MGWDIAELDIDRGQEGCFHYISEASPMLEEQGEARTMQG
jgi:hypothetical protein